MTLVDFLRMLRERWLSLLVCSLLGLLAAVLITGLMPKTYAATAKSFVSIGAGADKAGDIYQNSEFTLDRVASYTQVATSPSVLDPVIKELGLDMTAGQLANTLTVTNPTGTVLLETTATSTNPVKAQAVANAVSHELGLRIEELETPRQGTSSPVKVSAAVPASLPHAPVSPRVPLNLALGLLVGVVVGATYATARHQFDTSIKTTEELSAITNSSPLGLVRHHSGIPAQPLVALDASGPVVEDFRSIRTSLQFIDVDERRHSIVISSTRSEEGKSVTACNLAIAMAQDDRSVCLVEGDLRRPQVASMLGIDGSVGLSDVVANRIDLDGALVPWDRGLLTVLPAGTRPPDPSSLLGSTAVRSLLETLASRFDIVIIDAPPLLPVSDAAVLSRFADGVVLVTRSGFTRRDQIRRAVESLQQAGGRLLGVVLTQVPARALQRHIGSSYGYGTPNHGRGFFRLKTSRTLFDPSALGLTASDDANPPTAEAKVLGLDSRQRRRQTVVDHPPTDFERQARG